MAITDRLPTTEALLDSLSLPRDFLTRLGVLAGQATRQVSVDSVSVTGGTLSNLEIDRINLGNASIGNIAISDVDAKLEQSSAFLTNVRSLLELDFHLKWKIDLGWIGSWDGQENLGSIDIPVDLGNIAIPDLDNIDLAIPAINVPQVVANMKPITDLQLGNFSLSGADIQKLALPAAGLTLTGLGVGELSLSSLSVPGATSQKVSVAKAKPELDLVLPGATVQNLSIPQTLIPNIQSGAFETEATASSKGLRVNLGILDVTISVTPTVHLDVGAMTISDAQLSASLGSLSIEDIHLPVSVDGINASAFEANGVSVNQISF